MESKDMRMVLFSSVEEFERGRSLFPKESGFSPLSSLIIPKKALAILKSSGLKFQALEPFNKDDLTPEENKDIDENKARLISIGGTLFFINAKLFGLYKSNYRKKERSCS